MVAPSDNWIKPPSTNSSGHTGEGVIIDIGTGDGRFVYQSARQNPTKFYIGIDPNTRPLEKISEKIYRKPAKGGAGNVLFIQAAIEDLPAELRMKYTCIFRGAVCCARWQWVRLKCCATYGEFVRQERCWRL